MTESGYRKRLAEDLPRWRAAGWVSDDGAAAILASLEGKPSTFGLAAIVGVLGALLIGAGVVAFVGANWEAMPRIVRFGLLVAAMAVAYGIAGLLAARHLRVFSDAALLAAGLVFAAAIALVGQTYHLAGDFADAVLLWEIGIIGAALVTASATMTMLALAGAGYWTWLHVVEVAQAPHWPSLGLVAIGCGLAMWIGGHYGRIVAVLALGFWIGVNIVGVAIRLDWSPFEMLAAATTAALLFWAAGSALATLPGRKELAAFGEAMLWPGIAAVIVAVGLLQTAPDWDKSSGAEGWRLLAGACLLAAILLSAVAVRRRGMTVVDALGALAIGIAAIAYAWFLSDDTMTARIIGGAIVLGASLWAVSLGQTGPQFVGKKTGLTAFGVEIIYLYVVTLGTLMDTALAFLVGGILFVGLAYLLVRIDRRLAGRRGAEVAP